MIRSAASHLEIPSTASAVSVSAVRARRRLTPQAGHALEILGHAVEYLSDEFMHEYPLSISERAGRMQAIELIMYRNRQVYFECPEIPSIRDRFVAFIRQLL